MNIWMKKWIPVLSLVLVPVAEAQGTGATTPATQTAAETVRSVAQPKPEEQKLEEIKQEVDGIRSELNSERELGEVRQYLDQDSHPLWP